MCGIAGYIGSMPPEDSVINRTLGMMASRGPDFQTCKHYSFRQNEIRLLHSRLSIIDLDSRSNQPFTVEDVTVVFNGEIYNYLELRKRLEKTGVELLTTSDTEVLVHYYLLYGEHCVQHFEGMWAFAIFDARKGSLFLSRDRFGEKPLYYIQFEKGFFFGSEIKYLRSLINSALSVNYQHLLRNLVHGYKSLYKSKENYFKEIQRLEYAENLTLNHSLIARRKRYWNPQSDIDESMSLEDAISGSRELLLKSMEIRMRSDVPLSFCLSGGVDSASLASIAVKHFNAQISTFSIIDSDERYNEEDNILATINDLNCKHHLIPISQDNPLPRLQKLIEYHDGPISTISYFVHSMISQKINEHGFRVAFSGTSADELFTGYYDHFMLHLNEMRHRDDYKYYLTQWEEHIGHFVRNELLRDPEMYTKNPHFRAHIFDGSEEIRQHLAAKFDEPFQEKNFTSNLMRNRMLNELFHEITPVILHEDDLNSMCYSIENRSPYLDTRLQQFTYSIPAQHLIREGFGKYILRESVKGILNDQVRLDRRKKGFNASINSMIDLKNPEITNYLLDPKAEIFELVNRDSIAHLLKQSPIPNHLSKFIFNFINARIFLELK